MRESCHCSKRNRPKDGEVFERRVFVDAKIECSRCGGVAGNHAHFAALSLHEAEDLVTESRHLWLGAGAVRLPAHVSKVYNINMREPSSKFIKDRKPPHAAIEHANIGELSISSFLVLTFSCQISCQADPLPGSFRRWQRWLWCMILVVVAYPWRSWKIPHVMRACEQTMRGLVVTRSSAALCQSWRLFNNGHCSLFLLRSSYYGG